GSGGVGPAPLRAPPPRPLHRRARLPGAPHHSQRKEVPMMSTKTLPDVQSREQRTLSIIAPNFSPDNVIISSEYPGAGGDRHYPVEVRRKDLLAALGAEPDESDYAEVLAENDSLGRKLARTLRERDAARSERDAARIRVQELLPDRDSWKDRAEEATKDRDAAERERDDALEALRAAEEPRDDQDQIDRSWALEKAGEVLGRLAA